MGSGSIERVVIAGAGPAGGTLAIRLARSGFEVMLVERENFPRHKLCGEFISPECRSHFADLEVESEMLLAGANQIRETKFYSRSGRSISIESSIFGGSALGLSRARMDQILLEKARSLGVKVLTATMVTGLETEGGRCRSLTVRSGDQVVQTISGDLFVDATGRAASLSKLYARRAGKRPDVSRTPPYVALKAHFANVNIDPSDCEMYAFSNGYGGINTVEDGLANFCCIVRSSKARSQGTGAEEMAATIISQNPRASEALGGAKLVGDRLAVSIQGFGCRPLDDLENLIAVGDSAAFIDPFTGSGMLMAIESSALLAKCISGNRYHPEAIRPQYREEHRRAFSRRLRAASLLRFAADSSAAASALIAALSFAPGINRVLARSTRA